MIDGVSSIVFASTLGIGTVFSAVTVLLYQGLITLLSSFLSPLLTEVVISQMSFIGNILIMGIGFNFIYKPKLKLSNMLPAIFLPIIYHIILTLI
jgi:uncharacterized membrane protein YqgA involved in biofilm formation